MRCTGMELTHIVGLSACRALRLTESGAARTSYSVLLLSTDMQLIDSSSYYLDISYYEILLLRRTVGGKLSAIGHRKEEVITFKADVELAKALGSMPNKSDFIRRAILSALGNACPVCSGTGALTVSQMHHSGCRPRSRLSAKPRRGRSSPWCRVDRSRPQPSERKTHAERTRQDAYACGAVDDH